MTLILTDEQKVALAVAFTDRMGNPASVEGSPVWASSDPCVEVTAAADGLSAVATTTGPLGTAQVSVSADADLGEGVKSIVGTLDIEVVAAEAANVGISAGAPEPK
jgi:alkylation response protein AidB-like acyl-CoA dehydrogenase